MSDKKVNLNQPEWYINRELSALDFNWRVMQQVKDNSIPLLERLRFLFICSSNLDEFFEIRVSGIKEKIALLSQNKSLDGLTPEQTLEAISIQTHLLVAELYSLYQDELLPKLKKEAIFFTTPKDETHPVNIWAENYFKEQVLPVLSPIGLDHAHPFPRVINKSLNFMVSLDGKDAFGRDSGLAIVHAPRSLPRVIKVPEKYDSSGEQFIFLSSLIKTYAWRLFPGMDINGCYQFRITRNSDLFLDEEEIDDLAHALKRELRLRNYGNLVRLEIEKNTPQHIVDFLLTKHQLKTRDVYYCDGPVNLIRYLSIIELSQRDDLKYPEFTASIPKELELSKDIFAAISTQDVLLHHPYQSFDCVINFIHQATHDENVLAIKQTLYRTHVKSKMVKALVEAARRGKEVTAIIELRARFDEASNIELANHLHNAGVLVLYGIIGYKIHAKLSLVVRKEQGQLKCYAHLGTGNYHERTARRYTDYGLITSNPEITGDVQTIFQQLTGMGKKLRLKKLFHAPFTLDKQLLHFIHSEMDFAKNNKKAKIIIKVNGITDKKIIQALYKASQAGVKIILLVRGVCRLRAGIKGLSENIQVFSIIGRFLEHSRIYYFKHNGEEKLFLSSADLMERNLYYRVEAMFPIEDMNLKKQIMDETLTPYCDEKNKHWVLKTDDRYYLEGTTDIQQRLLKKYT